MSIIIIVVAGKLVVFVHGHHYISVCHRVAYSQNEGLLCGKPVQEASIECTLTYYTGTYNDHKVTIVSGEQCAGNITSSSEFGTLTSRITSPVRIPDLDATTG